MGSKMKRQGPDFDAVAFTAETDKGRYRITKVAGQRFIVSFHPAWYSPMQRVGKGSDNIEDAVAASIAHYNSLPEFVG